MKELCQKQPIAIYGAGGAACSFFVDNREKYDVVTFYTSTRKRWGTSIMGIPVQKFVKEEHKKEHFIVIASKDWKQISGTLVESGLKFVEDFAPMWMMEDVVEYTELRKYCTEKQAAEYIRRLKQKKKIAVMFGNCQTAILQKMMSFHSDFRKAYTFFEVPAFYEYKSEAEINEFKGDRLLWESIDLLIYQHLDKDNHYSPHLASEYFISKVGDKCHKICISIPCFDGYFPQLAPCPRNWGDEDFCQGGLFAQGDRYIDGLVQEGYSVDEIIRIVSADDFLTEQEVDDCCNRSLEELKRKEQIVDVKIYDYIRDHPKFCVNLHCGVE